MLKKFSKFLRNNLDPDPDPFFSSANPGSGSASELNRSYALNCRVTITTFQPLNFLVFISHPHYFLTNIETLTSYVLYEIYEKGHRLYLILTRDYTIYID